LQELAGCALSEAEQATLAEQLQRAAEDKLEAHVREVGPGVPGLPSPSLAAVAHRAVHCLLLCVLCRRWRSRSRK
jgi:hypothetical protein